MGTGAVDYHLAIFRGDIARRTVRLRSHLPKSARRAALSTENALRETGRLGADPEVRKVGGKRIGRFWEPIT
jgi:hypothetical protein